MRPLLIKRRSTKKEQNTATNVAAHFFSVGGGGSGVMTTRPAATTGRQGVGGRDFQDQDLQHGACPQQDARNVQPLFFRRILRMPIASAQQR